MRTYIPSLLIVLHLMIVASTGELSAAEKPELVVKVLGISERPSAPGILIRFENHTQKPIKILRPLDGSEWGWHFPIYALSIADAAGKDIPMGMRCGMSGFYSNMKWPDDYLIQILPSDAYEMAIWINRTIPVKGRYRVAFTYSYGSSMNPTRPDPGKYPDDLWKGTASSEPVDIELPASP